MPNNNIPPPEEPIDTIGEQQPPFAPTATVPSFPPAGTYGHQIEPGFRRFKPFPTAKDVRNHQLFGIPLRSAFTGEVLPDETIEDAIVKAVSEIEHDIKLFISPVTITREAHNYQWDEFYYAFGYLQTNHRPILEVQALEVSIPTPSDNENLVEWPSSWMKVYREHGTIQLVPLTGSGSILVTQISSGASFPIRLFNADNYPQFWRITYRVGFENDQIPAMLVDLIEVCAAMRILEMLGPIFFPYNSYGISADGLSQSVSLPQKLFFERLEAMKARKGELIDAARSYYELKWAIDVLG